MRMTLQDWFLLLVLSFLWGGSFFFAAIAVQEIPPLTVVALRTGIAALILIMVLHVRREGCRFNKQIILAFFVMGLLNNLVPFSLLFWAQTMIPSGLASILNASTPIFSIVVAHFLLADERMTTNKVVGVLFGFFGVIILFGGNVLNDSGIAFIGMLACLGAAVAYGFAGVYGRRFKAMKLTAIQVAFGQLVATTIMIIPVASVFDTPWALPMPNPPVIASVLALAIVSTALAYVIFFRILASAGAVNVALVTLIVPVTAIILGRLILGEELALRHYAGMALIGAGLISIDGRITNFIAR